MPGTKGRSGGHNRKSIAELKLTGAYRPSRHAGRTDPELPAPSPVVKPARLSATAAAIWDEVAPIAIGLGSLTPSDVYAFSTLCELQATFTAVAGLKGTAEFNAVLERQTAVALRPYLALFGLDPVSRSRRPVTAPAAADDFAEFDVNPLNRFLQRRKSKWAGVLP